MKNELEVNKIITDNRPLVRLSIQPNFHFTYKSTLPNWFHRLMARLLLGFKWEIVNAEKEK